MISCPNDACDDHGKDDQGNVYQHGWTDKKKTIRNLRCRTCGKEFSEQKGLPWFDSRLSKEQFLWISRQIADGAGIRPTARLGKVSPATVMKVRTRWENYAWRQRPWRGMQIEQQIEFFRNRLLEIEDRSHSAEGLLWKLSTANKWEREDWLYTVEHTMALRGSRLLKKAVLQQCTIPIIVNWFRAHTLD